VAVPLAGVPRPVITSVWPDSLGAPLESLPVKSLDDKESGVFSSVLFESSVTIGLSLTSLTLMETVAGVLS